MELDSFSEHMDLVFFFYGLAFFVLGATVLAQPRRENGSELVRNMWLLGIFGVLHGCAKWLVLLQLVRGFTLQHQLISLVLSSISFLFLFEFGRRVLRMALGGRRSGWARWTEVPWLYGFASLSFVGFSLSPVTDLLNVDTWARYTLAFPGALAAAAGLLIYAHTAVRRSEVASAKYAFLGMACAFGLYGLLSAVVPPADFFPARYVNMENFLALFGVPVQVFRAAVAGISVIAVAPIFHLFHTTARHNLQNALADASQLRQRSEMILETTDDAICGLDRAGRITFANPAAGQLLGCSAEQLLGRSFMNFRDPLDSGAGRPGAPAFPCPLPHRSDQEYFRRQDGGRFPAEYSSTPRYEHDELTCAVVAFRDITQRKKSELAQRWKQQQRFRAVFEQAGTGMALVSLEGVCLQVNERLSQILDRPVDALLNVPFDHFMHHDEQAKCLSLKEEMIRGETSDSNVVETRCVRGEQDVVWVQLALSLVRDRANAPMYCVLVVDDITERKRAEAALLRSRADLERSQGIAKLGSWELNIRRRRMYWSNETVRILGRREPEHTPSLREFLAAVHPADYAKVNATVQGWCKGHIKNLEYRIVRPDGEERFVHVVMRLEYTEEDSPLRVIGTVQDITERKQTEQVLEFYRTRLEHLVEARTQELEASNRDLESANRELEAFSYSVSHDLRGPLRAINGFTQALEEDYREQLDAEGRGYIARVRSATVRMGELIDGLLNLSRVFRSDFEAEPVDLSAVAGDIARQLRAAEPERGIGIHIEPDLVAEGDPTLVRLLLQNLIGNAWKFTADRETPQIVFGRKSMDGDQAFFVRDNGVGFEMEYAHKLFQPFERLHAHDEYEGTGIGLATVRRIVQRHGGKVWAEGALDQGAAIYFTLVPSASPDEVSPQPQAARQLAG